jgi:hypothetical protein
VSPRDFAVDAVVGAIKTGATRGQRRVSIATLCEETGLSRNGVRAAIRRAIERHAIARVDAGTGGRDVGLYRLVNGARNGPAPTLFRSTRPVLDPVSDATPRAADRVSPRPGQGRDPMVNRLAAVTRTNDSVWTEEVASVWFPENGDASAGSRPAARSRPKARANPPARERRRDPLFDAVAECWLGDGVEPGRSAGGLVGKAAAELRGYGAEPGDVRARWDELCRRYDEPTPAALAKHWPTLGRAERRAQRQGTRGQSSVDAALARAREAQR